MPRPVRRRTAEGYKRELEAITRLRTAVLMDSTIDKPLSKQLIADIDKLTDTILLVVRKQPAKKTA